MDISPYAVEHAMPSVRESLVVGNAKKIPFEKDSFDLVLSINTLSELSLEDCKSAIGEIERVSKGNSFITLNSWRNEASKMKLQNWNLTALSNFSVKKWKEILKQKSYTGDYYWFILE